MSNPILDLFQTYSLVNGVCEVSYNFEPSPVLSKILKDYESTPLLYLEENEGSSPPLKLLKLPGEFPGFRVKTGKHFIYLNLQKGLSHSNNSLHEGFKKHFRCMSIYNLYYPQSKDILEYWNKPNDNLNKSELYLNDLDRSKYLTNLISLQCPEVQSTLEIGCNLGRNLNYLKTRLNHKVAGCEISQYALQQLRKNYPALNDSPMFFGPVQEKIKIVPENSFDLVFSMAVLMHLHPSTPTAFWEEIKRVAKKNIITIENEGSATNRAWPRNYKKIFESIGCKEIYSKDFKNRPPDPALENYNVRIFEV